MNLLHPLALASCLLLPACTATSTLPHSPAALVHTARTGSLEQSKLAFAKLDALNPGAQRDQAIPDLLRIVERDPTDRALWAATVLCEWDKNLLATAPQFHRIRPRLYNSLSHPNMHDSKTFRIPALEASRLLMYMGPDPVHAGFLPISRRFLAPADEDLDSGSAEFWTRHILALLLFYERSAAAPVFLTGLDHSNYQVRTFSIAGLAALGDLAKVEHLTKSFRSTPEEIATARTASRSAMPKVVHLFLHDQGVASYAIRYLEVLAEPSDITPPMIAQLLQQPPSSYWDIGPLLRKIYPAASEEFLNAALLDPDGYPAYLARSSISRAGPVFVPPLVKRLNDEAQVAVIQKILLGMEGPALRPLFNVIRAETDPVRRARAAEIYHHCFIQAQSEVLGRIGRLPNLSLDDIKWIRQNAPAAVQAVPFLERFVAAEDHAPELKSMARDMLDQIKREQLPIDPTR